MDYAITRRHFMARAGAYAAAFTGLRRAMGSGGAHGMGLAAGPGYGPLVEDPEGLIDLPDGFSYTVFSRTGETMDDGLLVPGAHDGMAALAGPDGLTLIVRNHELELSQIALGPFGGDGARPSEIGPSRLFDGGVRITDAPAGVRVPEHAVASPGGTTTLVYDTKPTRQGKPGALVTHSLSLAGTERNCAGGPTPRNTWISCEETVVKAGAGRARDHGYCFEVAASAEIGLVEPVPLREMGRFMHEACATDPATGIVYLTEDRQDGLLYRFVPTDREVLSRGGVLEALAVRDRAGLDTRSWGERTIEPGQRVGLEWITLDEVGSPLDDLRYRGFERGAARFARGEGMWYGRGGVYFVCTSGGAAKMGQVWKLTRDAAGGELELFIECEHPGPMENPDNITVSPWGDLILCEDEASFRADGVQRLYGVTPEGEVYVLGRNRLNRSEFAGATFSPDGTTLFVNIQRPGMTLAIVGPWR
jgi:uncharacterized protein